MKRRAYLLILGILAVTSVTWAATPPSAVNVTSELLPLCNCDDNADCGTRTCQPRPCVESNGLIEVCR